MGEEGRVVIDVETQSPSGQRQPLFGIDAMFKARKTRQVPANTLNVGDACEYGTVKVAETAGGMVKLTTESGDYDVPSTQLVWLTTAHLADA